MRGCCTETCVTTPLLAPRPSPLPFLRTDGANPSASVAHPTETIKCKLQLQLVQPEHVPKQYSGPFDVVRQTYNALGITGMWRGLGASFMYRSCFAAMFGGESGGGSGARTLLGMPSASNRAVSR